jgi:hypothetical protein
MYITPERGKFFFRRLKKSRKKPVLGNLSLVKVSFAERKVLGGEKEKNEENEK